MKNNSKFNIKDKVYLVVLPWSSKATLESIRIVSGSIS